MSAGMRRSLLTAPKFPPDNMGTDAAWPGNSAFGGTRVYILTGGTTPANITTQMSRCEIYADATSGIGSCTWFTCTVSGSNFTVKAVGPSASYGNTGNTLIGADAQLTVDSGDLLGVWCSTSVSLRHRTGLSGVTRYTPSAVGAPSVGTVYSSMSSASGTEVSLRAYT